MYFMNFDTKYFEVLFFSFQNITVLCVLARTGVSQIKPELWPLQISDVKYQLQQEVCVLLDKNKRKKKADNRICIFSKKK